MNLLDAAKAVPDPEVEGFCPHCSKLKLISVMRRGDDGQYIAYIWQHQNWCWYDQLQRAIAEVETR